MRRVALVLAAIVLCVTLFLSFGSDKVIVNYPSSGTDVIAFGDSLVEGVGSARGGGFVKMLSEDLSLPIVNLGISGNTTEDALGRLEELSAYKPKVVLVLLGGNDFLRKVPEEETFQNLERIIRDIQARGSVAILLGVRSGVLSNRFDGAFEELSDRLGVAYVPDVLDGVFGRADLMNDSLHPNDKGYRIIADKVGPVLEELI